MVKEVFIYLDYNATTPVDPRVLVEMMPIFNSTYANPAFNIVAHEAGGDIRIDANLKFIENYRII